jgi:hypothetical protein
MPCSSEGRLLVALNLCASCMAHGPNGSPVDYVAGSEGKCADGYAKDYDHWTLVSYERPQRHTAERLCGVVEATTTRRTI